MQPKEGIRLCVRFAGIINEDWTTPIAGLGNPKAIWVGLNAIIITAAEMIKWDLYLAL